jgi:lambda repressor-like predicted transcriptional regulator
MKSANRSRPDGQYHAVRFYDNDKSLALIIAEFLGDELGAGQPGIVVATPAHRAAILRELVARGLEVVRLQRSGDLLLLDAEDTLSTFMRNGHPDGERFRAKMCEVIRTARRGRGMCTLRIYGQMVDILWKNGHQEAAIRLEVLWNQLANTEAFSLLCGYAMGPFYKDANFDRVCRQHTHLISADGEAAAVA